MPDENVARAVRSHLANEPKQLQDAAIDAVEQASSLPMEETHGGGIERAEKRSGIVASLVTRRNIIRLGAGAGAVLAAAGAIASIYNVKQSWDASEKADFSVSRKFALHIAGKDYGEDPLKGYEGTPTLGELAIADSMVALATKQYGAFDDIYPRLKKAFEVSADPYGRTAALSRMAIDSSFAGDGERAMDALSRFSARGLLDPRMVLRFLDFGTSVALNGMEPKEFRTLSSAAMSGLGGGWEHPRLSARNPREIARLAPEFGVGVFSLAQRVGIDEVRQLGGGGPEARFRWIETIREVMYLVDGGDKMELFTTDFLFSLHRPIFHAATYGGPGETRELLDYYFGRSRPSSRRETQIDRARTKLQAEMPGSSPWMFLLDVAYDQDFGRAKIKFTKLLMLAKDQNRYVKKAIVSRGMHLGFDESYLMDALGTDKAGLHLPSDPFHKIYLNQVSQIVKD